MKNKIKYIFTLFILFNFNFLYSYEIIRDPIFEEYFSNISKELKLKQINIYLVKNKSANAFVINDSIYFTTGLLQLINNEDTLKAIYFHEYAHVINNHFQFKKIKLQQNNNKSSFYNLFSVGLAVISGNTSLGIGTSITLNNNLINDISRHSINFEIEADNYMINLIKKNKLNTSELINFLNNIDEPQNNYFKTHPRSEDRINNLEYYNFRLTKNSAKFEWIKSKYSKNSKNDSYNSFFNNLEKGYFNQNEELKKINKKYVLYEAFKKGFFVEDWDTEFQDLLIINNNSFLKIEYINYILDNNLINKYKIVENLKFNKKIMKEYFYNFIYGKYYDKINKSHLSNFYFCQFYSSINDKNKADFFCKKYDIKNIPTLDKSYAVFK